MIRTHVRVASGGPHGCRRYGSTADSHAAVCETRFPGVTYLSFFDIRVHAVVAIENEAAFRRRPGSRSRAPPGQPARKAILQSSRPLAQSPSREAARRGLGGGRRIRAPFAILTEKAPAPILCAVEVMMVVVVGITCLGPFLLEPSAHDATHALEMREGHGPVGMDCRALRLEHLYGNGSPLE